MNTTPSPKPMRLRSQAALLGLVVAVGMAGCNANTTRPDPVPAPTLSYSSCALPGGHDLSTAMSAARGTLSKSNCQYQFDAIESELMGVAAGNPGQHNREPFHDFYRWSADQGVLTRLQAKEHYTRYFTVSYAASMPNDVSTCGMARDKKRVLGALADDVAHKEQGLMQVLGDRDAWFKAKQGHDDLVFLVEGTLDACVAGR